MDHLDYGLSEPKLALLPDGSVFVAGQIQAPMEPPAAQSAMKSNKLMAADSILSIWSTLFGTIATPSSCISSAYPLDQVTSTQLVGGMPSYSFIGVPLPMSGMWWTGSVDPPLPLWTNSSQRSFILKVMKPTSAFKVTDITLDLVVGPSRQNILTHQWRTGVGPTTSGVFHQIDATTLPANSGWAANWISTQQQQSDANPLTKGRLEFYSIQVTFPDSLHPAQIPYGRLSSGIDVTPPPGSLMSYDFQISGATDPNAVIKAQSPIFSSKQSVKTIGLWSAAQFFQSQYYPTWDNDKWCSAQTFIWISRPENLACLEPVNDISGEHGPFSIANATRHNHGDEVDMFHPGYTMLCGTLASGCPEWSGHAFRNKLLNLLHYARGESYLGVPPASQDTANAKRDLARWIYTARQRLGALLQTMPKPAIPNGQDPANVPPLGSMLYLTDSASGVESDTGETAATYQAIRALIVDGEHPTLDLTDQLVPLVDGTNVALGAWGINLAFSSKVRGDNRQNGHGFDHTHHTHISIYPPGN